MKKIFITGANGMVGRNLRERLVDIGYEVLAPVRAELDLLNFQQVKAYVAEHRPEIIIHCAGKVGGIQDNIKNPVQFLIDNLEIGKNIVMAARENRVKRVLNLGSSCMYPRNAENPLKEDLILQGELEPTNEGYALAKISVARLCEYISREDEFFEYKTIIPCNLYGKYDKFDPLHSHMIPAVIRKIHEAKVSGADKVEIWGDGLARREFMIADELVDFIEYALNHFSEMPSYLNVGLGHDYSINEYYENIAAVVGWEGEFVHDLSKPVGMKQKVVDIKKLTEFGWKSKTTLRDGLGKTYSFFLENYGN